MDNREFLKDRLDSLLNAGADKAECRFSEKKQQEMNVQTGELNLLRTNFNYNLNYAVIKDNKKGTLSLNKTDRESVESAVKEVLDIAASSESDAAHDIAGKQDPQEFIFGPQKPDQDKMYRRLQTFLQQTENLFPSVILEEVYLDFTKSKKYFLNSNGVDLKSQKGIYSFVCMFTSREGNKSSSFNYTGFAASDLDREIMDCGTVRTLLKQSQEQVETKRVNDKFNGDVLIAPDCAGWPVSSLTGIALRDEPLISETSFYKDSLNEKVADENFTLHSRPTASEIAKGYYITSDGYAAENSTLIKNGVLKSYLLSLYGANKTGRERAVNNGGAYVIEKGEKSYKQIIKSIERGIILNRFSGGYPSQNGDFSGVAKNSYYIEDGEVKYPISETMISGNLKEMFNNIKDISQERINFGDNIFPWMLFSGLTISGK